MCSDRAGPLPEADQIHRRRGLARLVPHLLIIALAAHTACVPVPSRPRAASAASERLELKENGNVVLRGKVVSLEEVTRCNPAAHAEAMRENVHVSNSLAVAIAGLAGLFASQIMLGYYGLSKSHPPPWIAGVGVGGTIGFIGLGAIGAAVSLDRVHARNAVSLYNQRLPPCGPPPSPAGRAEDSR